jgi:hypothetical protein
MPEARVISVGGYALRRETYERAAIGAITLAILLFLPAQYFLLAFVMLGQGHFLMTYLYQWKGGKIGGRYLAAYAVALGLLAYLATFVLPLPVLLLITGSVFALHFFYDEARLYARDNSVSLGMVWYPALLFFLVLIKILYAFDVLPVIVVGTLLLVLQVARRGAGDDPHPTTRRYMAAFAAVLLAMLILPLSIPATAVLGAIILYHYMSWYVHYFFRLQDAERPVAPYLKNGLLVNALVIGCFALYFVYSSGIAHDALAFVFAEHYFYMWTLLHILFASNEFLAAVRNQVLARS